MRLREEEAAAERRWDKRRMGRSIVVGRNGGRESESVKQKREGIGKDGAVRAGERGSRV